MILFTTKNTKITKVREEYEKITFRTSCPSYYYRWRFSQLAQISARKLRRPALPPRDLQESTTLGSDIPRAKSQDAKFSEFFLASYFAPLRLCGRYSDFWLRLRRAGCFVVKNMSFKRSDSNQFAKVTENEGTHAD